MPDRRRLFGRERKGVVSGSWQGREQGRDAGQSEEALRQTTFGEERRRRRRRRGATVLGRTMRFNVYGESIRQHSVAVRGHAGGGVSVGGGTMIQ